MSDDGIRVGVEDGVGTITFARPDRLNAFDDRMIAALANAANRFASDDAVRAILLTGTGRAFCAGLDLRFAADEARTGAPPNELVRRVVPHLHGAVSELRRAPKPVVCAVNGVAAGAGVGLALAGDVVLASSAASFVLSYTRLGLAPDGSTTYFVTRLVGEKRALDLFFSTDPLEAPEAQRMGLVSRVIDPERLDADARLYAKKLAAGPTRAYALAKSLVLNATREGLETQMENERHAIQTTFGTADFREGLTAFFEKRSARFVGR
jgi:2-(1,2-epoxy-1,2-dihydrophenyl)acetyl-CoA isomerase